MAITESAVLRVTEVPRPEGTTLVDAWDRDSLRGRYDDVTALVEEIDGPARARFESAYDALGPLAELRVRELVAGDDDQDPADAPRYHRVRDIAEARPGG